MEMWKGMTGREFIKWILDNEVEDCPIEIVYRTPDGKFFPETDKYFVLDIDEKGKDEFRWNYRRVLL